MKKEINQRIRLLTIAILALLFVILVFDAYAAYNLPTEVAHEVTVLTYTHGGDLHYDVSLKPNNLYGTTTMGPGNTYFRKITEHIDAAFGYEFTCDRDAEITCEYDVIASVASGKDWEKCYVLVPQTTFNSSGRSATFAEDLRIDLAHYEEVVSNISDEIGVRAQNPTLTIKYNIHTIARTNVGDVDEFFTPSLVIPLNKNAFTIESNADEKTGSIKTKKTIIKQNVKSRRTYSAAAAILVLISLILFVSLTRDTETAVSKAEKEIRSAKKKYGDWIADATDIPIEIGQSVITLRSLSDLVKVAEELGKPIIQKNQDYYVFDGSMRYEYRSVVNEEETNE